jgi:hypothetical protein
VVNRLGFAVAGCGWRRLEQGTLVGEGEDDNNTDGHGWSVACRRGLANSLETCREKYNYHQSYLMHFAIVSQNYVYSIGLTSVNSFLLRFDWV